jgi:hypothetical protein
VKRPAVPARLVRAYPWLRRIGFLGALAVVVLVAVDAGRHADLGDVRWWLLAVAVVVIMPWWLGLGLGWGVLAQGRANRADMSTWCRTQTLRYLPGGFWAPVSRVAVISGSALDRVATVFAENLIALCAALAIGGLGLALAGEVAWIPLVLLVAAPTLLARLFRGRVRVDAARARSATATYLAAFAAYAAAAVLVQAAVSGWQDPLGVAGAAAVAWAAGLVVIIAPSGVGVREVVYAALLPGSFGAGEPATAALALRLVTIAAELAVLLAVGRPGRAPAPQNG